MKNKKAIALLFIANTITGISQGISLIAIPWFIANEMDMPSLYGGLYFFSTLIAVFWGPYAGALVDRYDRKNVMLAIQTVGFVLVASLALWGFLIGKTTIAIACGVFLTTKVIYNIHYPNLYAFAQEITEPKYYGRITSWLEIQGQTTFTLSGAMAAFLMEGKIHNWNFGKWEVYEIFMLDAGTYLLAVIVISMITYNSLAVRKIEPMPFLTRLKLGFGFLKRNPLIFLFGNASYFLFAAILVSSFFTLPIFIKQFLNETERVYGLAESAFALGSLLSGIFILFLFPKDKLTMGIIFLMIISAVLFVFIGFNTNLSLFLLAYLVIGFGNAGIRVLRTTYIFNVIPNSVIGRTSSVFTVINSLFRMLFIALFSIPFFNADSQIRLTMFILAAFILSGAIVLWMNYSKLALLNRLNQQKTD
jgi:MFS transporter, DHA3 family, macrolide efflux protein